MSDANRKTLKLFNATNNPFLSTSKTVLLLVAFSTILASQLHI
jgi:hypothetical protein